MSFPRQQQATAKSHSAENQIIEGDDGDRLVAKLLPKYNLKSMTHEEAQREISALTAAEIAEIHADVSGVPGLSTTLREALQLNVSSIYGAAASTTDLPSTSPTPSQVDLLRDMNTQIQQLPIEKNSAYRFARELKPQLVNAKRKGMFLDYADGDAGAAALRMAQYWEARVELFGPERAFESDLGMSKSDIEALAERAVYRLLPYTDTAGRAIICIYPGRRKFAEYSADEELRGFWYLLESVIADDCMREQGVVFVMDGRHMPFEWMFSTRGSQITTLMIKSLPLTVKGIHLCYVSRLSGACIGTMKWIYGKEMRLRFRIHCGDEVTVLGSLEQHSLPKRVLPCDLGGDLSTPILCQFTLHGSMPGAFKAGGTGCYPKHADGGISSAPQTSLIQNEADDKVGPPPAEEQSMQAKLKAMDRLFSSKDESCTKLPQDFVLTAEEESLFINPKEKGGRKSQPRMNKAVVMAIRYPNADRYEILVAAGFVFPTTDLSSRTKKKKINEKAIVDVEGISLPQRKNQLRRRIKSLRENYDELKSSGGLTSASTSLMHLSKKRAPTNTIKSSSSKKMLRGGRDDYIEREVVG